MNLNRNMEIEKVLVVIVRDNVQNLRPISILPEPLGLAHPRPMSIHDDDSFHRQEDAEASTIVTN